MSLPTPQDMAAWPTPDYDSPHEPLTSVIYGVNISLMVLMTIFVCGRFYSRIFLTRSNLGADDWTMLIAFVMAMGMSIAQVVETEFGVGRHLYDVKPEWFPKLGKASVSIQAVFGPCSALTKISICLTYLRLFPSKINKWFNYIQIGILIGFGISTLVGMLVQCRPIENAWDFSRPDSVKNCIDKESFFIAVAAINSGTDFLVYLWPSYYLWRIKLSLVKRIGLIICFGVGTLICVAGIIRITWQIKYAASWDQPYNGAIIFIIVAIEVNLGIVCGCLPGIRPIIRRLFPKLQSSTQHSERGGYSSNVKGSAVSWKDKKGFQGIHSGSIRVTNEVELSVWNARDGRDGCRDRERIDAVGKGRGDSEEWIFEP
ncbi:hypothetical protein ASPCAL00460 [Aspergillus calidoustus]|uniref:Rhodopsin domain-containing protein n=1 Tax=Aspergillus calidoustus TaxID=454130 RepID=A0A0U5FNL5_ASPCI|nr:hypothetical protein ASPCAL00460 [Aspergillus calidoustus]